MTLPYQGEDAIETGSVHNEEPCKLGRARLVRELFMAVAVLASG